MFRCPILCLNWSSRYDRCHSMSNRFKMYQLEPIILQYDSNVIDPNIELTFEIHRLKFHLQALNYFLSTPHLECIICEDDLLLIKDFPVRFQQCRDNLPPEVNFLSLLADVTNWNMPWAGHNVKLQNLVKLTDEPPFGANIYWLTRTYAKQCIEYYDHPLEVLINKLKQLKQFSKLSMDIAIYHFTPTIDLISRNSNGYLSYPPLAIPDSTLDCKFQSYPMWNFCPSNPGIISTTNNYIQAIKYQGWIFDQYPNYSDYACIDKEKILLPNSITNKNNDIVNKISDIANKINGKRYAIHIWPKANNVLQDIVISIIEAMLVAGHQCRLIHSFNHIHLSEQLIMFGTAELTMENLLNLIPINKHQAIVFNFEQLYDQSFWISGPNRYDLMLQYFTTWDYNHNNLKWMNSKFPLKSTIPLVTLGYSEIYGSKTSYIIKQSTIGKSQGSKVNLNDESNQDSSNNINQGSKVNVNDNLNHQAHQEPNGSDDMDDNDNMDIDVLFIGSSNPRRQAIFDRLLMTIPQLKFVKRDNAFGLERADLICRAKIVLNCHYYDIKLLEIPRIVHLLSVGAFVISETSSNIDEYPLIKDGFINVDIDDIADKVKEYLSNYDKRREIAGLGHQLIQKIKTHISNGLF